MKKFILSFAVACFCLQSIWAEVSSIEQANEAVASPKKSSKKEKAKKILKTTGKVLGYSIVVVLFVTLSIGLIIFAGDELFNDRRLLQKIPHPNMSTVINGAESAGRAIIPIVSDGLTSAGSATLSLVQKIPHPDLSTVINGAKSAGRAIIPTVKDGLTSAGETLASAAGNLILSEVSNSEKHETFGALSGSIALTTNDSQEPTSNKQSKKNPATQTTNPTTFDIVPQMQLSDAPLATIEIVDPNKNTPDENATQTLVEVNQSQPFIATEAPILEANPEDQAFEINTATMFPQSTRTAPSSI